MSRGSLEHLGIVIGGSSSEPRDTEAPTHVLEAQSDGVKRIVNHLGEREVHEIVTGVEVGPSGAKHETLEHLLDDLAKVLKAGGVRLTMTCRSEYRHMVSTSEQEPEMPTPDVLDNYYGGVPAVTIEIDVPTEACTFDTRNPDGWAALCRAMIRLASLGKDGAPTLQSAMFDPNYFMHTPDEAIYFVSPFPALTRPYGRRATAEDRSMGAVTTQLALQRISNIVADVGSNISGSLEQRQEALKPIIYSIYDEMTSRRGFTDEEVKASKFLRIFRNSYHQMIAEKPTRTRASRRLGACATTAAE